MMVSPSFYSDKYKNSSLDELKNKRDELIKEIKEYEKNNISESEMFAKPSPETRYKMNLEYLKEILDLIIIKINNR